MYITPKDCLPHQHTFYAMFIEDSFQNCVIRSMSFDGRGLYRELYDIAWFSEHGYVPNDPDLVHRTWFRDLDRARFDSAWNENLSCGLWLAGSIEVDVPPLPGVTLAVTHQSTRDVLVNILMAPRIEESRQYVCTTTAKGRKAADTRWAAVRAAKDVAQAPQATDAPVAPPAPVAVLKAKTNGRSPFPPEMVAKAREAVAHKSVAKPPMSDDDDDDIDLDRFD